MHAWGFGGVLWLGGGGCGGSGLCSRGLCYLIGAFATRSALPRLPGSAMRPWAVAVAGRSRRCCRLALRSCLWQRRLFGAQAAPKDTWGSLYLRAREFWRLKGIECVLTFHAKVS